MSSTCSISSEASIARSAGKDDTSDSSLQLHDTKAADGNGQAAVDESMADGAGCEKNASEKEQETVVTVDDAIAAHNKRLNLDEVSPRDSALSVTVSNHCSACVLPN